MAANPLLHFCREERSRAMEGGGGGGGGESDVEGLDLHLGGKNPRGVLETRAIGGR